MLDSRTKAVEDLHTDKRCLLMTFPFETAGKVADGGIEERKNRALSQTGVLVTHRKLDGVLEEYCSRSSEIFSCYFQRHFVFHNVCFFEKRFDAPFCIVHVYDKPLHRGNGSTSKDSSKGGSLVARSHFLVLLRVFSFVFADEEHGAI